MYRSVPLAAIVLFLACTVSDLSSQQRTLLKTEAPTNAGKLVTAGITEVPLPFTRASLVREERENAYVFLFCMHSCRPDDGYWAWLLIPFANATPERLQIVTAFNPKLQQTCVHTRQQGNQFVLTLTFVSAQGYLRWRTQLQRSGLGKLLDPASAEHSLGQDAQLKVE